MEVEHLDKAFDAGTIPKYKQEITSNNRIIITGRVELNIVTRFPFSLYLFWEQLSFSSCQYFLLRHLTNKDINVD